MEKERDVMYPPPPYRDVTDEAGNTAPERGSTSAFGAVESFVMDCSDGDEDALINGKQQQRVPCRWQQAVKVKDYGMWNMCSCLCCCWIVAIVGVYKSLKSQSAKRAGQPAKAARYSRQARVLFWVSFCIGLIVYIVIAALYGYFIVSMLTAMRQNPSAFEGETTFQQLQRGQFGSNFPQAEP